jgi:hypothetical protein
MAGLWRDSEVPSFAILSALDGGTSMPVILHPRDYALWLQGIERGAPAGRALSRRSLGLYGLTFARAAARAASDWRRTSLVSSRT